MRVYVTEITATFICQSVYFLGVSSSDLFIGLAIIDLKYIAKAFLYAYDRKKCRLIEDQQIALPTSVFIDSKPDLCRSSFRTRTFQAHSFEGQFCATTSHMNLDITVDLSKTKPLRLCTRAGYNGWVYTQKTTPATVSGTVIIDNKEYKIDSPHSMAVIDWTAGFMQRETFWNWASIASTLNDGRNLGLNLSCGVNETGFTENFFVIGDQMTKVDMVHFDYHSKNLYNPWSIRSYDKKIELTFTPEKHRSENINAWLLASKFTQLMGQFSGQLKTDTGETIYIDNCPGWAEDHFARW
ncbi:MAG: hypothetical protein OMM_03236 [Candidatus Magnetoglobus multicellularis str. Araruama]|uniref:DUF2804 domain-containing protein n=1 Tax=Candidatus Magnetoglobus multicellularis str. Araruama TaxID=890399 RepID=A0A1V1P6E3_9BACT|nr:MAG: hypothetical protein OMM_03236 [Candidatus Magnetoglobus multicellularis str. Araruama]